MHFLRNHLQIPFIFSTFAAKLVCHETSRNNSCAVFRDDQLCGGIYSGRSTEPQESGAGVLCLQPGRDPIGLDGELGQRLRGAVEERDGGGAVRRGVRVHRRGGCIRFRLRAFPAMGHRSEREEHRCADPLCGRESRPAYHDRHGYRRGADGRYLLEDHARGDVPFFPRGRLRHGNMLRRISHLRRMYRRRDAGGTVGGKERNQPRQLRR